MNNVGRALARGCALAIATALASPDANLTPDLLKHVLEAANIPLIVPSISLVCCFLNVGRRQPCRLDIPAPAKPRPDSSKQRVISDEEGEDEGDRASSLYARAPPGVSILECGCADRCGGVR